ncbi:MAG: two-component system response regulator CreB [Pseudomonadota bacterium]
MAAILLVEDEPSIVDTLAYVLKSEGHGVLHAGTGSDALARIQRATVQLVIVDVGLPDIDGFELVRRLRAHSTMPVMFLTAHADEVERVLGFELGADDYVTKPFSPREVAGRVRAILRRTGGASSSVAQGFVIDQAAAQVSHQGRPLPLTRYEYLLLAWLLRHPRHVFSREQLLDAVWGQSRDSTDRTVDTHIKTLRAKLREAGVSGDPIQTHRGLGYSLQP